MALDGIKPYLPDHKYYACNQDEQYAPEVLSIILSGENKKNSNISLLNKS